MNIFIIYFNEMVSSYNQVKTVILVLLFILSLLLATITSMYEDIVSYV